MTKELINVLILSASFLALFSVAELLYHFLKVKAEFTRKLVHFGTGVLTLLFPIMLGNQWWVLFLCSSFAVLLLLSIKFNFLKSINAIDRKSVGSIAYPVAVYLCYLAFDYFNKQYIYFYAPILTLAICDPLAALFGKKWPLGKYKSGSDYKTLMGSTAFFISAFILNSLLLMNILEQHLFSSLLLASLIALASTITEAFSKRGIDNITIPASVLIMLILLIDFI